MRSHRKVSVATSSKMHVTSSRTRLWRKVSRAYGPAVFDHPSEFSGCSGRGAQTVEPKVEQDDSSPLCDVPIASHESAEAAVSSRSAITGNPSGDTRRFGFAASRRGFPVSLGSFPVPREIFPVRFDRELFCKPLKRLHKAAV
jgi:hypothetical protein